MKDTQFDLSGRVALVTGAGVGIGRAVALALAGAGAFVGIHYRNSRREAEDVLVEVRRLGGDGLLLQADLTSEAEANAVVDQLVARAGQLQILVNNAGDPLQRSKIEDCPLELWQRAFAVNVTSAFLVTRRAIPHLKIGGNGSIINMVSLSTQTGGANGAGAYAAAKGAMLVFTRTLARELAPRVRSNTLCPGVIETRHHEVFTAKERMAQYRQETPLGRNGTPQEVAQAALFLASDASSFTNGAIVDVNGGRFLR
jgi:3-oxoacyl-[acyl-carrier protein] reductase